MVHAASATGQTVFVEPLETIEINNRLVQFREEEAAEIARILEELTARIVAERGPLSHAAATIAEMDALFARGLDLRANLTRAFPSSRTKPRSRSMRPGIPCSKARCGRKGRSVVPLT